ncbi:MAG: SPOR domain-containing protein, partial [bacterium]
EASSGEIYATEEIYIKKGIESAEGEVLLKEEAAEKEESLPPGDTEQSAQAKPTPPVYHLQVGVFSSRENALQVKKEIEEDYGLSVYVKEFVIEGQKRYRVQAGVFKDKNNAEKLARELRLKGYPTYISQD